MPQAILNQPWVVVDDIPAPPDELTAIIGLPIADDALPCQPTIGRQDALDAIARLTAKNRHVLLTGPRGAGKSHLLWHCAENAPDDANTLTLEDFKAQRSILIDLCMRLHERGHLSRFNDEPDEDKLVAALSRLRIRELTALVVASVRGRSYTLYIDRLDTLTPSGVPTLHDLAQHVTIVAAADTENAERIKPILDKFNIVELGPLPPEDARQLLWLCIDQAEVADPVMLEKRILDQTGRLPGAIVDATQKITGGANLADIRSIHPQATPDTRVDLTWMVLIVAACITAMRYISRGLDSTTMYIVFGVLSACAMVSRVLLMRLAAQRHNPIA